IPSFNVDSAYNYIAEQVAFGPRVLGSAGHAAAKDWLVSEFKKMGAKVIEQDFTAEVYTGDKFPATNIIAQFNPNVSDRILLGAHWDTRHIADSPLSVEREEEPILGADDGGSGVGVLLEIARQLQANPIGLGVDLILFDAEDYGQSNTDEDTAETYCLGSQYWGRNPHSPYKARYGVLLDMVGAKDAKFLKEGYSYGQINPELVNKIWSLASRMGKSNYFVDQRGPAITDDHVFVYKYGNVPMIDIINISGTEKTAFGPHWHTHNDNMDIIDKNKLRAVGQVMLAMIYREDAGTF
ncbi:MAG: M28 family peptidase, partial [Bacteroidota bacterium]